MVIQEEIEERAIELTSDWEMTPGCDLSHPLCGTGMCACDDVEIEKSLSAYPESNGPCAGHNSYSEEQERRMDIIGQNGNDGLHYSVDYSIDPEDGQGCINYSSAYPGDIKITYDEIQKKKG